VALGDVALSEEKNDIASPKENTTVFPLSENE
jgi:hypothetical protein